MSTTKDLEGKLRAAATEVFAARQVIASLRISVREREAVIRELGEVLWQVKAWRNFDGDGIHDPLRQRVNDALKSVLPWMETEEPGSGFRGDPVAEPGVQDSDRAPKDLT